MRAMLDKKAEQLADWFRSVSPWVGGPVLVVIILGLIMGSTTLTLALTDVAITYAVGTILVASIATVLVWLADH